MGIGHIAQVAVLPAFAHARNSRLTALVSDDPQKREALGRKYRVPLLADYDQFEGLVESGEVDAVYIALPNDMHAEFAVLAAQNGVHVLCEKPMATTVRECQWMIQARDEGGVKMMIAYRLHFERANLAAIEAAQSGRLGDLRSFNSEFSMNVRAGNIRTQSERAGGPLYDIGIYCINAARYLFRAEPLEICAMFARRPEDERFAEVEEGAAVLMRFPDDRLASFIVSFGAAPVASYRIVGTRGDLLVDNAYEYTEDIVYTLTIDGRSRTRTYPKRDQFAPELLYFSECILHDRAPEPSAEEGLIDVRIIEAIHESARSGGCPISIGPLPGDRHPGPSQEIRRPPVRRPALINAQSGSTG